MLVDGVLIYLVKKGMYTIQARGLRGFKAKNCFPNFRNGEGG